MQSIAFGQDVLHHTCGFEFEKVDGAVTCIPCGGRWTVDQWNKAQRRQLDEARLRAVRDFAAAHYRGPGGRTVAGN